MGTNDSFCSLSPSPSPCVSKQVQDPEVSTEDFFRRLAPPSTSRHFRLLHKSAMDLYLGGPEGGAADWQQAAVILQQWYTPAFTTYN